jgi:HSP20 family protein
MGRSDDDWPRGDTAILSRQFRLTADAMVKSGFYTFCTGQTWTPALNVYEDDRNYYLVVNLAGVGTQAVELEYRDGKLYLSGHRPTPPPPEVHGKLKLLHMEIDYGRFERVLEFPADVDGERIEAVYRTGQLLITLPKAC